MQFEPLLVSVGLRNDILSSQPRISTTSSTISTSTFFSILGSVELLTEMIITHREKEPLPADIQPEHMTASLERCIAAIRSSGTELMTTVNNILTHNTWMDEVRPVEKDFYDLRSLEGDILGFILPHISREQAERLSVEIFFENHRQRGTLESLSPRKDAIEDQGFPFILLVDSKLLQDCLAAVLLNAIQACNAREVAIVSLTIRRKGKRLEFIITDNGRGIEPQYEARIFEPYEKISPLTPGSGLGLTLSATIAHSIGGSLRLLQSEVGAGSSFKFTFLDSVFKSDISKISRTSADLTAGDMPRVYCVERRGLHLNHFLFRMTQFVESINFRRVQNTEASLVLTNGSIQQCDAIALDRPNAVIVRFAVVEDRLSDRRGSSTRLRPLISKSGPITSTTLVECLAQAERLYTACFSEPVLNQIRLMQPKAPEIAHPLQGGNLRALLVDDNAVNLKILEMFCIKRKIPYCKAMDGNEAINCFNISIMSHERFDLILMDLQMPNCDGFEATKTIRETEKTLGLSPAAIFIITGQDSESDRDHSRESRADLFLVKPVGPKVLDKHIKEWLGWSLSARPDYIRSQSC